MPDPRETPRRCSTTAKRSSRSRAAEPDRVAAAAQEGQAHRARAARPAARRGQLRRARPLRHPPLHRFRPGAAGVPGDGVVTGYGPDRRPAGLRLLPGLHRVRRLALRGARREDLQDHGPGAAERRAGHRAQRLGRRPDPGRRRLARRLRRHLPAQHARLRASSRRSPRSSAPAPAARSTRPAITDFIFMVRGASATCS